LLVAVKRDAYLNSLASNTRRGHERSLLVEDRVLRLHDQKREIRARIKRTCDFRFVD
jgi:hypothetical protein